MPRNWKALADASDGLRTEDDFRQALYQLVGQQCLYARFPRQAVAYRLISEHREAFAEAADLMGLRLAFNDRLEFCYATQELSKPTAIDLRETRFILTLRHLYHLRANDGLMDDFGAATVGIDEAAEVHKTLCGEDLERRSGGLRELLRVTARFGLAREIKAPEGDPQPFIIELLPGIAAVISETAVDRFGAALKASLIHVESRTAGEATAAGGGAAGDATPQERPEDDTEEQAQ